MSALRRNVVPFPNGHPQEAANRREIDILADRWVPLHKAWKSPGDKSAEPSRSWLVSSIVSSRPIRACWGICSERSILTPTPSSRGFPLQEASRWFRPPRRAYPFWRDSKSHAVALASLGVWQDAIRAFAGAG